MKAPHVYYISQGKTPADHLANIKKMVDAQVDWVQLRIKDADETTIFDIANQAQSYCQSHDVKFIINDSINIAKAYNADGVHLGKQDAQPSKAREILDANKIVGGTANTLEDCLNLIDQGVDYIGVGPFRFTTTKKNLSPILALEGYQKIISELKHLRQNPTLIAIGGITLEDIPYLTKVGISGVALSSELHRQNNLANTILHIKNHFQKMHL
ncbi:thiamine phosphate synthase [Flavobacteriaceae bacterium Ap0902]|nr:thiamine phosphate synthase [Flavobacteriaceae bacterium Ap0902]